MKRFILMSGILLATGPVFAQAVAVYPVKTEGFKLNQSEVTEMSRIAMQSCYDAGLRCSGRGMTTKSVEREQGYAGGGQIAGAAYVAECALLGKTEERFNVGTKKGGIDIFGGAVKKMGKGSYGGVGSKLRTSGIRIGGGGMNLACQFSSTSDGVMAYSETDEKMGLSGELILFEGRSSNVKKLQKSFTRMFENFKKKMAKN